MYFSNMWWRDASYGFVNISFGDSSSHSSAKLWGFLMDMSLAQVLVGSQRLTFLIYLP